MITKRKRIEEKVERRLQIMERGLWSVYPKLNMLLSALSFIEKLNRNMTMSKNFNRGVNKPLYHFSLQKLCDLLELMNKFAPFIYQLQTLMNDKEFNDFLILMNNKENFDTFNTDEIVRSDKDTD